MYGAIHQSSKNIAEFICYLGIAILASRLKVNLPGITGTLSVNFLFILIGVLELSFSETLILGAVSMMAQCLFPDRPNAIQVTFNVCAGSISTALAYVVYHHPLTNLVIGNAPLLLGLAALDERAEPSYDRSTAEKMVSLGAHVSAMTPGELAEWVASKVK